MQIPHFVISHFQEQCLPSLRSHCSHSRCVSRICRAGAHPEQAQSFPRAVCECGSSRAACAPSGICENLENGALSCALLLRSPSQPCCGAEGSHQPHGVPAEQRGAQDPPAGTLPALLSGQHLRVSFLCPGLGLYRAGRDGQKSPARHA